MVTIGITGPSGAGKGTVSEILRSYGFYIIDADIVYHNITSSPSDCINELVINFGNDILTSDGALDRNALSSKVFSDGRYDKLKLLNSITHKYVVNEIRKTLIKLEGKADACVIDAPLLIEAGLKENCLFTIAVLADKEIRINRISQRDGISIKKACLRINAQKNDEYYISMCDYTIYNNGNISDLKPLVDGILRDRGMI